MTDAQVTWVATMSDGTTVAEHSGEYVEIPGQRMPWIRLTSFLAENDLHLTSLRVNVGGRTIHMPRVTGRFVDQAVAPLYYSVDYKAEAEMGDGGTFREQKRFIDLIAHYDSFEVHYIQSLDATNAWVIVTEGYFPMAPTPRNLSEKEKTLA